jgi:hypothetical protein
MEAFSSGALLGIALNTIYNGETGLLIAILIPTIYYNYKFFKNINKSYGKRR